MSHTIVTYGFGGLNPYLIPTFGFGGSDDIDTTPRIDIELISSIQRTISKTCTINRSQSFSANITRQLNFEVVTS